MGLRGGRLIGGALSHGFLAAVVLGAGAAALVASGPVPLPWLARELERRAAEAMIGPLDGLELRVSEAEFSAAGGFGLRLRGVELAPVAGDGAAIEARAATIGVDPLAALFGDLRLTRITIEGARLAVTRGADGAVRFEIAEAGGAVAGGALFEPPAEAAEVDSRDLVERATQSAADAFARAAAGLADAASAADGGMALLASDAALSLTELDLTIVDEPSGRRWRAPDAALALALDDGSAAARLDADMRLSRGGRLRVLAEIRRAAGADAIELTAETAGARLDDLWREATAEAVEDGVSLEGVIDLALTARVAAADGALLDAQVAIGVTEFAFSAPGLEARRLDRIDVEGALDPERRSATLSLIEADGPTFHLVGQGRVDFLAAERGGLRSMVGLLEMSELEIRDPMVFDEPLLIDRGRLSFDADFASASIAAPSIVLEAEGTEIRGRASAFLGAPEGGTYQFFFEADPFDAAALPRLWPTIAAPGARAWVAANVLGGRVDTLEIAGLLEPSRARVDGSFSVSDVTATYLADMPPIEGGVGVGRVSADGFVFDVSAGRVDMGDAGVLTLGDSRFVVPSFSPSPPPSETTVAATGPLTAVLALLDHEPLGLIQRFDGDIGAPTGQVEAQVSLAFPLAAGLRIAEIDVLARGSVTELEGVAPGVDAVMRADRATFEATTQGLRLESEAARLEGRRLAFVWRETFGPGDGEPRTILEVDGPISRDRLRHLGVQTEFHAAGPIGVDGELRFFRGGSGALDLALDMSAARLRIPPLEWTKPEGVGGRMRVRGTWSGRRAELGRFDGDFDDLDFAAALRLGAGGALSELRLETLRMLGDDGRPIMDLALTLSTLDDGRLGLTGGGPMFDFDAFFDRRRTSDEPTGTGGGSEVALDLQIDALRLAGDAEVRDARVEGVLRGDAPSQLAVRARAGAAAVVLQLTPDGADQRFFVSAEDAGAALRGLGLVAEARGGRLRLSGVAYPDGSAIGELQIDDIVVEDAPVMASVLSSAFVLGILDRAGSGGITLTRVRAPFRVDDQTVYLDDAAASGPALGMTLTGTVDRLDDSLDLSGSLSPAFAINGILSEVPLIGDLLTGGAGSGVLGVAFSIRGRLGAAQVSVNPLSALAPGPFRRIFSGRASPGGGGGDRLGEGFRAQDD